MEGLSQRADVSFGLVSQLERGQGNPSFVTLSKLAEALGVSLVWLMQGATPAGMHPCFGGPRDGRSHRPGVVAPTRLSWSTRASHPAPQSGAFVPFSGDQGRNERYPSRLS